MDWESPHNARESPHNAQGKSSQGAGKVLTISGLSPENKAGYVPMGSRAYTEEIAGLLPL